MFLLLCFLSSSTCDRTIELIDMDSYDSIATSAKETICFKPIRQHALLLFKHTRDYVITGYPSNEKQKVAGFYFGAAASNQVEIVSTKDSHFSFISTYFVSKCQNITVSTLDNDQIIFTDADTTSSCHFHSHKNSTYAITMESYDNSVLIGLKSGMKFAGKVNDFIRSSSEIFIWLPSKSSEDTNNKPSKTSVVINMPNKYESNHGFKATFAPNQFYPIVVERRNHHHDGNHQNNGKDDQNTVGNYSYEYPPKYNYNNVYQNGSIIFSSLLSVIVTFVGVFLVGILFIRLFFCICLKKRQNTQRTTPGASDIPPVEIRNQLLSPAQPQSVQVTPIQGQIQYPQFQDQQQQQQPYVFYPNLQQNQFVQQPQYIQQQPQFISQQPQYRQQHPQQNPLQQVVYI